MFYYLESLASFSRRTGRLKELINSLNISYNEQISFSYFAIVKHTRTLICTVPVKKMPQKHAYPEH